MKKMLMVLLCGMLAAGQADASPLLSIFTGAALIAGGRGYALEAYRYRKAKESARRDAATQGLMAASKFSQANQLLDSANREFANNGPTLDYQVLMSQVILTRQTASYSSGLADDALNSASDNLSRQKRARNSATALYVVGGVTLVFGLVQLAMDDDPAPKKAEAASNRVDRGSFELTAMRDYSGLGLNYSLSF